MLGAYTSHTFCRVCQIDERLIDEKKRPCILMSTDPGQNVWFGDESPGRIIGVAEEFCYRAVLWMNRNSTRTFHRDSIFPKGMRRNRYPVTRSQGRLAE